MLGPWGRIGQPAARPVAWIDQHKIDSRIQLQQLHRSQQPAATAADNYNHASFARKFVAAEKKRAKGIEPSCVAWKATVLPLNYAREYRFNRPKSMRIPLPESNLSCVRPHPAAFCLATPIALP